MLIMLVGPKESGKSTVADYLQKHFDFLQINFKDALDAEIKRNFPDLLEVLAKKYKMSKDDLLCKKPLVPEVRALKINYGTEVRRGDKKRYWVEKWEEAMDYMADFDIKDVVADDCRFKNEERAGKKRGAIIIRLSRKGKKAIGHSSETEQDNIDEDFCLVNNGSIKDLEQQVQDVMIKISLDRKFTRRREWRSLVGAILLTGLLLSALSIVNCIF